MGEKVAKAAVIIAEFLHRRYGEVVLDAVYDYGTYTNKQGLISEVCKCGVLPSTIKDKATGRLYLRPNGKAYISFDGTVMYYAADDKVSEA